MTNIFIFNINTLDNTTLNQEFESKSEELDKIPWDTTRFDLEINLDASAISSVDQDFWENPQLEILNFIKSNVIDLRLFFDIKEYRSNYTWTYQFLNQILYKISKSETIKYLKIELPDSYHINQTSIFNSIVNMPELKSLDLTKCYLKTYPNDTTKSVFSNLINFFKKIQSKSKLTKIFLPYFLERILIIDADCADKADKLETCILEFLENSTVFIKIYPFSFFNKIYNKYKFVLLRPGALKYLYHNYQTNLETINKIQSLEPQNNGALNNLLKEKENILLQNTKHVMLLK